MPSCPIQSLPNLKSTWSSSWSCTKRYRRTCSTHHRSKNLFSVAFTCCSSSLLSPFCPHLSKVKRLSYSFLLVKWCSFTEIESINNSWYFYYQSLTKSTGHTRNTGVVKIRRSQFTQWPHPKRHFTKLLGLPMLEGLYSFSSYPLSWLQFSWYQEKIENP